MRFRQSACARLVLNAVVLRGSADVLVSRRGRSLETPRPPVGGHRSAVVVDDFDVVPVGVQDERAVVAGVVHGALPRTAVVLVAVGECGGVERLYRGVLAGGEREVDVLG